MKRYIGIIIFVVLFISAVSIVAILIARGYNFTGNEIKESGIINITSMPEDAAILINGEEKGNTPKKIELIAGRYEINILKDGYKDWKKEIEVEPSIVTDISLTLFPIELHLEQITFTDIDKAFFSNDGSTVLYTVSKKPNKGIWLSKLEKSIFEISSSQTQKVSELDIIPQQCLDNKEYIIKTSSDNTKSIIECKLENYRLFFLLDLQDANAPLININKEIGFNPNVVNFSFDTNNLFVIDNEIIVNYNTQTNSLSLVSRKKEDHPPHISAFGKDFLLLEYSYDNQTLNLFQLTSNLNKTPINLPEELEIDSITKISSCENNENQLALSTLQASYILSAKQANSDSLTPFSQSQVDIISWSHNGKSFLFRENNQLKTAVIKVYPDGSLKAEIYTLLENYNHSQTRTFWTNNSQQILINNLEQNKLYVIDKDGYNQRLLFEGELTFSDSFRLSENATFLVLLLKDDNGYSNLYSIKLKI